MCVLHLYVCAVCVCHVCALCVLYYVLCMCVVLCVLCVFRLFNEQTASGLREHSCCERQTALEGVSGEEEGPMST